MRLFVAVELGERVLQEAAELIAELRRRVDRRNPRARLTWVTRDRMHLTVRFIGEVDEAQGARVMDVLRAPIGVHTFDVEWRGPGAFPKSGPPRVLWVGASSGVEGLRALEQEVSGRLERAGTAREDRPYSPHLTLARVREAGGLRSSALFDGLADLGLGTTHVAAITLFQSQLSPKGPTYVALQRTELRAG